jgi:hypothetical protein
LDLTCLTDIDDLTLLALLATWRRAVILHVVGIKWREAVPMIGKAPRGLAAPRLAACWAAGLAGRRRGSAG